MQDAERMARIRVSGEVWADFRRFCGSKAVSEVLGTLVEGFVRREKRKRAEGLSDLAEVIREARQLRDEFDQLAGRLEKQTQPQVPSPKPEPYSEW